MGGGSFNTSTYYANAATYTKKSKETLFVQRTLLPAFNPLQIAQRESCASKEHPDPTSIIIACDVTGSMGKIPDELLKGGLGKVMESLLKIKSISNPQVMFAAIGDTQYDEAPLQVTQFESDNRIEAQLKDLYLEGRGGGNKEESYNAIWYFAAHKTKLESLQAGKKGILFTMGDELMPKVLKADHIRKFIDKDYKGTDILTSDLLKQVGERYEVFHLIVQDTSTYQGLGKDRMDACWKQYLGERAISVVSHTEIPQMIINTIQSLCESSLQMEKLAIHEKPEIAEKAANVLVAGNVGKFGGIFSGGHSSVASSLSTLSKDSDNIPYLFLCPISQELMEDPVVAEDGFTYNRADITKWLQNHNTSPKTSKIIGKLLIDNNDLKSAIKEWQEKQEKEKPAPASVIHP